MNKIAYVIIHGFGGTPKDVESIKEQLIVNGVKECDIFIPLLKGHGTKGKIKVGTKYEDIITDLKKYVEDKCRGYDKVYVFGYSMGGLVSIALAVKMKVDKLILLNAPMHIWCFRNFVWTLANKPIKQKIYHIKTVFSSFRYNKVRGSLELGRLQKYVRENLSKIESDVYIVQSKHDYVARPISANEIYNKIGSRKKKIKWYEATTHYMPDEKCIDSVIGDALDWAGLDCIQEAKL